MKDLLQAGFGGGMLIAEQRRSFERLVNRAEYEAGQHLPEKERMECHRLLDEARSYYKKRNDMMHACWTTSERGEPLRLRPALDEQNALDWTESRLVSLDEVDRLTAEIEGFYRTRLDPARSHWRAVLGGKLMAGDSVTDSSAAGDGYDAKPRRR